MTGQSQGSGTAARDDKHGVACGGTPSVAQDDGAVARLRTPPGRCQGASRGATTSPVSYGRSASWIVCGALLLGLLGAPTRAYAHADLQQAEPAGGSAV